jgi:hypothetical protein
MTNIKVTVEYEAPKTNKFDALMAEYEVAKKLADETVAYYKPLADVAEAAKFDAIMQQLETIKEYAKRIGSITKNAVWLFASITPSMRGDTSHTEYFKVVYRPNETKYQFEILFDDRQFTKERFGNGRWHIISKWEKFQMYEQLEKDACDKLQEAIKSQKARAQYQIDRLNDITKGGM